MIDLVSVSRSTGSKKSKSKEAVDYNKLPKIRFYKHWHDKLYKTAKYEKMSVNKKKAFLKERMEDFKLISRLIEE